MVLRGGNDMLNGHFGQSRISYRDVMQNYHQWGKVPKNGPYGGEKLGTEMGTFQGWTGCRTSSVLRQ